MRRLTPLLVLAFAACSDGATTPAGAPDLARIHEAEGSHGGTPFMAVLVPETEVPNPPGGDPNPDASGVAFVTLNSGQEEVCFEVTFSGLSGLVSDAHIHEGAAGIRGPVVIPFAAPVAPPFPAAPAGTVAQCVPASRELIKEIRQNPENFYVNVHTRSVPAPGALPDDRPGGAIRGPLMRTQGSNVNEN
jgi:hypothetical protein